MLLLGALVAGPSPSALFDTHAFFTDSETSAGNSFTAGALDGPGSTLNAVAVSSISLTWDASTSTYNDGYEVFRRVSTTPTYSASPTYTLTEAQAACSSDPSCAYLDNTGLSEGVTYCYKVRAFYDADGNGSPNYTSPFSNEDCATEPVVSCTNTSTALLSPTAQAADTGGNNNGFELNPTGAFADNSTFATNAGGGNAPGDRHRYYNYGITLPSGCEVKGIEVRLDAWSDIANNSSGMRSMSVELSWDGGTSWTTAKSTTLLTPTQATFTLGSPTDTWGHTWILTQHSNTSFRVRVTSNCTGSAACQNRDFFLDWIPVKVYYGP